MPRFSNQTLTRLSSDREYRHKFVQSLLAKNISAQIKKMRENEGWTQKQLAEATGKPQSTISRIEGIGYGKHTLKTLCEIAEAFDVALHVRFVSFSDFARLNQDLSWEALNAVSCARDELSAESVYENAPATSSFAVRHQSIANGFDYFSALSRGQSSIGGSYSPQADAHSPLLGSNDRAPNLKDWMPMAMSEKQGLQWGGKA